MVSGNYSFRVDFFQEFISFKVLQIFRGGFCRSRGGSLRPRGGFCRSMICRVGKPENHHFVVKHTSLKMYVWERTSTLLWSEHWSWTQIFGVELASGFVLDVIAIFRIVQRHDRAFAFTGVLVGDPPWGTGCGRNGRGASVAWRLRCCSFRRIAETWGRVNFVIFNCETLW